MIDGFGFEAYVLHPNGRLCEAEQTEFSVGLRLRG